MVEHSVPPVPASLSGCPDAWISLTTGVLQHAADVPETLGLALRRAPDSPALLAANGMIMMLAGRRETVMHAGAVERAARYATGPATDPHDEAYVRALSAWVAGRPSDAAAIMDAVLERWPADAMALKFAQAIRFLFGDVDGMRWSTEAAIGAFADDHPHAGYAHGCHAFALEETYHYEGALSAGHRALWLCDEDAWGLHALAHVYEMTGAPRQGRLLIAQNRRAYEGCSTFRHHVDWHAALFELELGDTDAALALYDTAVRAEATDDYRDVANAVSLLARLEAEGVDVGGRWEELGEIAEHRADDACLTFADLHYLMALLADGRHETAGRMVARLSRPSDGTEPGDVAARAGAPASAALEAYYKARYGAALDHFIEARRALGRVGGSHAQRDVFTRIMIDAAVKAGRPGVAHRLIAERSAMRGEDRFARTRLAQCLAVPA